VYDIAAVSPKKRQKHGLVGGGEVAHVVQRKPPGWAVNLLSIGEIDEKRLVAILRFIVGGILCGRRCIGVSIKASSLFACREFKTRFTRKLL
jgi:hypothetical protein